MGNVDKPNVLLGLFCLLLDDRILLFFKQDGQWLEYRLQITFIVVRCFLINSDAGSPARENTIVAYGQLE